MGSCSCLEIGVVVASVAFFLSLRRRDPLGLLTRENLMVNSLPELSLQIIDQIRNHGRATIGDLIRITGASRNTLKDHFRRLVEKKFLFITA